VAAIGRLAKEKGIIFHSDATQAVGKIPVNVGDGGDRSLVVHGPLMYGPKGVGALYVRRKAPRVRIAPLIDGGGHERGMRSGTLPVRSSSGSGARPRSAARSWARRVRGSPSSATGFRT